MTHYEQAGRKTYTSEEVSIPRTSSTSSPCDVLTSQPRSLTTVLWSSGPDNLDGTRTSTGSSKGGETAPDQVEMNVDT